MHRHDTCACCCHGFFSIFESETGSIVDLGRLVVVEGGSIHTTGLALRLVGVFGSEIVVVVHAVAVHVLIKGVAGPVAVHVSGDAGRVKRVGAALVFDTVGKRISIRILIESVAGAVSVSVGGHVSGVHRVGATGFLVNVGPAIAVLVAVADITDAIAVSVGWHARGQQAVGITIQFINIGPRIAVIVVIVDVGDSVSIGVEENGFRFFVVDDVAATKTTRKNQHQGKQNSKATLHRSNTIETDI